MAWLQNAFLFPYSLKKKLLFSSNNFFRFKLKNEKDE
jgi:hypothetical protein